MQRCSHYLLVDVVHVGESHNKTDSLLLVSIELETVVIVFVHVKSILELSSFSFCFHVFWILSKKKNFVCTKFHFAFMIMIISLNAAERLTHSI